MAEKKITLDIVIESANAANSLRDIKQSLRDVNNELLKTEEGTAEYNRLASAAGKLKDKIGDLNDTLKTTQGSGLERFKNSLSLIREGFTNLDTDKFKLGIQGATQAFGGLGKAILATGIGALVVGVGALIANFDKLKNAGGLVGKVFSGIGNTIDIVTTGLTKLTNQWGLTSIATEKVTQETLDYEKALRDVNVAIEEAAIEEKLLRGEITEGVAAREQAALKRDKLKDDAIANFEKEAAAQKLLNRQLAEDEQKKYDELADIRDNAQRQADQQFSTDIARIEKNEKAKADAELKIARDKAIENAKKIADLKRRLEREFSGENELERLNTQEKETLAEARRVGVSEETLLNIRQEFFNRRLKLAEDSEKQIQSKTTDSVKQTIQQVGLTIQETPIPPLVIPVITPIEEVKNFFIQYEEQLKATLQISEQFVNALTSLNDLVTFNKIKNLEQGSVAEQIILRKSFERNKKLAIAGAVISGLQGVINALTAKSTIPEPFGTVLKVATAVSVAAATAVNIAKIASTKFESTSPPSAGGGGGANVNLPSGGGAIEQVRPSNFSLFGTGGSANNLGANEPQMIQAYVVESQVSSTQRRVERFRTAGEI